MTLLERDVYLQRLTDSLALAGSGRGQLIFLAGEAGIGKTVLTRAFLESAEPSARVLVGYCDPLSTPRPLGPLIDFASSLDPAFARLLSASPPRHQVFTEFLRLLSESRRPTILLIEDVHWADEATLDLLRFLGRRIELTSTLLLATFRNDEVGTQHPLRLVLGDLATSPAADRMTLPRLSRNAVGQLAADHQIDVDELYRLTDGNPFFVTEVLAAGDVRVPQTVRDAVLARAGRLSSEARTVLDIAAVIGFSSEGWLLHALAGHEIRGIDECFASGMLERVEAGCAFRHEIARETILETISNPRRIELNRLVLVALEASHIGSEMLARLAHHAEQAQDHEAVLRYAPAAARRAVSLHAHRQAAEQYARALRFADGLALPERAALLEAHAHECYLTDRLTDSIASWQKAIDIRHAEGEGLAEGRNLSRLARMLVYAGRNAESEVASRRAIEVLGELSPGPELAAAYQMQAHLRMLNRDNEDAIRIGQQAIDLAEQTGAMDTLIYAYNSVGTAMLLLGDDQGRDYLERSIALAQEEGLDDYAAAAYGNLGSAYGELYRFLEADLYLSEGIAFCAERDLDFDRYYMMSWESLSQLHQGRWDEATVVAADVLRHPQVSAISQIMTLTALGRVRARRGDPDVWEVLDQALELAEQTGTLQRLAPVRAARAEAAWLAGNAEQTKAESLAVYDLALAHRHVWHAGELAYWQWRAGDDVTPAPFAAEPYRLQLRGAWQAAAMAWEELHCPYEAARARADGDDEAALKQALVEFESLGAAPAAAMVVERLRELGAQGIPRGPRPATRENPAGLTPREMEIVELLVLGLRDAEIAERLYISPKTVGHHVSHVLAKLDARSRVEAAEKAREIGITPPK